MRNMTTTVSAILLMSTAASGQDASEPAFRADHFVFDSLRGILARDHASRLVHHQGKTNRSYVTYLDHYHDVMVTFYDHDEREWHRPVRVDHAPIRDGHAAPAVFVDSKGYVHTFSARGAIRHCRSQNPEDITKWEPTRRIGPEDTSLTYTYPIETPDGDVLLFYRLGSAGGNSPLAVSRSGDGGITWKPPRKLVDYGANKGAGTVKIGDAVYDTSTGRVHLALRERDNSGKRPQWYAHYCQYDPGRDEMLGLDGTNLGKTASREDLIDSGCRLPAQADLAIWKGKPFLLMHGKPATLGTVEDGRLTRWKLPTVTHTGWGILHLAGERDWRIYGYRPIEPPPPYPTAGDLTMWRSSDQGTTWDDGEVLVRTADMRHGLQSVNIVRRAPTMEKAYVGNGPFLLFQEAFGASYGRELRGPDGSTFSDMQLRFNRRLYALDGAHRFVTRGTPFRFSGYWDDRAGPPAGQAPGPRASFQLR